jgi:formylglycine-generating enzyme required for sulfatase activity
MTTQSGIWNDQAIKEPDADRLKFSHYGEVLTRVVLEADTPITIGVFGPWGCGKTSLMRLVKKSLDSREGAEDRQVWSVWFNAWRYDREEALWRALVLRVLAVLREKLLGKDNAGKAPEELPEDKRDLGHELEDLEASLYREVEREEIGGVTVDWEKMAKGAVTGFTRLSLSMIPGVGGPLAEMAKKAQQELSGGDLDNLFAAVQRERREIRRDHIQSLEQFQDNFAKIIEEQIQTEKRRLVVFIDDLDRCLPEKAIEVLEAIKLFLDVPGCVFLIAADRDVIEKGIRVKYKSFLAGLEGHESVEELARRIPITGDNYLEKIVQLPFHLPPLREDLVVDFIETHDPDLPEKCADIFSLGLEPNPRKVKRTLNIFRLLLLLAEQKAQAGEMKPVEPPLLAKMVIIQNRWRDLFADLQDYPNLLPELEQMWREEKPADRRDEAKVASRPTEAAPEEAKEPTPAREEEPLLEKYGRIRALGRMLRHGPPWFSDLPRDELEEYIYLARSTTEAIEVAEVDIDERRWTDLLSNDLTKIRAALADIEEAEKEGYVKNLLEVIRSSREPAERVSAGNALALAGDPRPGVDPEVISLKQMEFCYVPPGVFSMGSDDDDQLADDSEKPLHEVNIPHGYWIARYPVTVAQLRTFVQDSGHELGDEDSLRGLANHPAVWVSWHEALAFCDWLTQRWRDFLPEGYLVSLPSEAEWEKAARGGEEITAVPLIVATREGLSVAYGGRLIRNRRPKGRYPWGDEPDPERANYDDTGIGTTSAVGCFPGGASPYGCLDMAGNVWEWCATKWQDSYADYRDDNDLEGDAPRVLRGGAFSYDPWGVRCACRGRDDPNSRGDFIGFRVVVSSGSPE